MFEHLPEFVDPLAMAEKRRRLAGAFPLARMSRLASLLVDTEGTATFELVFGKEGRHATVQGRVVAELVLECQCCLAPLRVPLDSEVNLAVVRSIDEANRLPDRYEPLLLESEKVALIDLIEDELLLAVPAIPRHESCSASAPQRPLPASAHVTAADRKHPFAALAGLKQSNLQQE
jgi:uncharacterized protein